MSIERIKSIKKIVFDPKYRFERFTAHGLYNYMSDDEFIKKKFKTRMGYDLDIDNPKTFNEKLQWLKLHDRNPNYTTMVDKCAVKNYVTSIIGEEYIIPTYGIWDRFEDIDFASLPNQFVLKCTHDSGGLVIVDDKNKLDINTARKVINRSLRSNYFYTGREWPYKNVRPRIIAEEYLSDQFDNNASVSLNAAHELTDYKLYCFNGYVDCVMICYDRASGDTKFYFFDCDWNLKRINKRGVAAPSDFSLSRPKGLNEMFEIASKLSANIPFVRVDLYQSNGKVYFGELTLYPQSGWDPNYIQETDRYFGNMIDLSLAYDYQIGKEKRK